MPEVMTWGEKLDADGKPIPNCWETDDGYTISLTGRPAPLRYAVTRPGDRAPFSYVSDEADMRAVIRADIQASEVPA